MNRRLYSWNFRKLQSYIDYKAKLKGLVVIYVNPKNTSSLCPIGDGVLALNEHRILKCKCGYENDRDVATWLNILRMREVPLPQKAIYEALKAGVERIVIKSQLSDGRIYTGMSDNL
ncbi:MAG: zinc ribbon domain-containing protein [Candidatus Bathyarchaeia archaeon]